MKCPHCNEKIEKVVVISSIYQTAKIDEMGIIDTESYKTFNYEGIETIYCPLCDHQISSIIKEMKNE